MRKTDKGVTRDITLRFLQSYRQLYLDEVLKTKQEFCIGVGMLQQNFSLMEKGGLACTIENVYNLTTHYHISLDWLFTGQGNVYNNANPTV